MSTDTRTAPKADQGMRRRELLTAERRRRRGRGEVVFTITMPRPRTS